MCIRDRFQKKAEPWIDKAVHTSIDKKLLCANLQNRCRLQWKKWFGCRGLQFGRCILPVSYTHLTALRRWHSCPAAGLIW